MSNMDLNSKKANLKTLYEMCLRELDITRKSIDLYTRKVKDAYIDVLSALENSYGTADCFFGYDNTLTDLSKLTDSLRKFNLKCELIPLFKYIAINDDDTCDPTKPIFESVEESIRNVQNKKETYTYPQPLYDIYTPGNKFDIIITHIKNRKHFLFYINDSSSLTYGDFLQQLQNYFNESPKPLNRVPEEGEVVGLHLEGYMFRIVREDGSITGNSFKAYLLDIGEVIIVTEDMCEKLYVLSATQQKYCSQALLCKLEAVNSRTDINFQSFLEENLYVKHTIIVKKIIDHILYVDLLAKESNPFRDGLVSDSVSSTQIHEEVLSKSIINPFRKFLCVASEYGNQKRPSRVTEELIEDNRIKEVVHEDTYRRNSVSITPNNIFNNNLSGFLSFPGISDNDLLTRIKCSGNKEGTSTEEERRMLYEEPPNTTNAMKAVMGYEPNDDKVICPLGNSCFKGSRCRLEHVEKLKDGYTRDQAVAVIDIPNKIEYPYIGQKVNLRVTHIVNVERFFAHIITADHRYKPTLNELVSKMNATENKPTYKKLKKLPARFELVLAQYRDKMWYRARIVNLIDDETVKVFYVDYGNSDIIALDNIRQWEPKFEYLPFQAISCRLAGVKAIRNKALEACEFLRSKLLDPKRTTKALIINNVEHFLVRLFIGSNDDDLSDELIQRGYAESYSDDPPDQGQLLPS